MGRSGLLKYKKGIPKDILVQLYKNEKLSVLSISRLLHCSQNKINYWMTKYSIVKRSISDAIYQLKNPLGDPFKLRFPKTHKEAILYGMGLGLFWGEGTKRGKGGMRITNSDPKMLRKFIEFSEKFLSIDKKRLKFSLLIFNDILQEEALLFWQNELSVERSQFYKTVVVKVRGEGTYKYKSRYGVVVLQFNNTRLKELMCNLIENIQ